MMMHARVRDDRRDRLRRARWRLRGAWQWPTFALVTLADAALLHWLPLAGDGTGWVPALLLAGCLNLIVVAVLGGLGGWALRRRRPDLPKVVADDYAGTTLIVALAGAFLAIGLAHRPEVVEGREAFADQSTAVRRWVAAYGDAFARAHVDGADTLRLEEDLFRTCVPGEDPKRWLCLIVDTTASPPVVRRDPNRESNASLNRPGGFR
jgi:hypothetical protein